MIKEGLLVVCDRCGRTEFAERFHGTASISVAKRIIIWEGNRYEMKCEGWYRPHCDIMLCPHCNAVRKDIDIRFMRGQSVSIPALDGKEDGLG